MTADNNATITGNLGTEITVRGTDETPVVSGLIIASDGYYNKNDEWVDQSSAINFTLFGGAAKKAKRLGLKKGWKITVSGKMQSGSYDKNGQTVYTMELQTNTTQNVELRSKPKAKKTA